MEIGPLYKYFPNGSKTHVLAKPHNAEAAKEMFEGTGLLSLQRESNIWVEQLEHQLLYVNMLKVKMLGEWSGKAQ